MDDKQRSSVPYFNHGKTCENLARLCEFILTICSDVLRNVLSRFINPSDLRMKLDKEEPKLRKILNSQQMTNLYPKVPSRFSRNVRVRQLDITVLYNLLRHICRIKVCDLPAHRKEGWGKSPPPGDNCLCACIEKVRIVRNYIALHIETGTVDNKTFHNYWNELKEAVLAIETELFMTDVYEKKIDELLTYDLDPTNSSKYIKEFTENLSSLTESISSLPRTARKITGTQKRKVMFSDMTNSREDLTKHDSFYKISSLPPRRSTRIQNKTENTSSDNFSSPMDTHPSSLPKKARKIADNKTDAHSFLRSKAAVQTTCNIGNF